MKRMLIVIACALPVQFAQADTLLVDRSARAEAAALPRRGSLKQAVETQFGAPLEKRDAVGDPPITRWVYPGFSVYFEHDHVISSVLTKSSRVEIGPKPAQ
jgi:hypothetical protein